MINRCPAFLRPRLGGSEQRCEEQRRRLPTRMSICSPDLSRGARPSPRISQVSRPLSLSVCGSVSPSPRDFGSAPFKRAVVVTPRSFSSEAQRLVALLSFSFLNVSQEACAGQTVQRWQGGRAGMGQQRDRRRERVVACLRSGKECLSRRSEPGNSSSWLAKLSYLLAGQPYPRHTSSLPLCTSLSSLPRFESRE